ncbi:MAG: protein-disulfide reductase DsbD domain-containing protein [Bacteroidota bacterium]
MKQPQSWIEVKQVMHMQDRTIWLIGLMLGLILPLNAQIEDPVSWSFKTKQLNDQEFELIWEMSVERGWHVYSQFTGAGGPVPTSFTFEETLGATLEGAVKEEGKIHKGFDELFQTDVAYFEGDAIFKQKVKLTADEATFAGYLTFMVCDDEKCLPPKDIDFTFSLAKPATDKGQMDQVDLPKENPKVPQPKKPQDVQKDDVKAEPEKKGIETPAFPGVSTNPLAQTDNSPDIPAASEERHVKWTPGFVKLENGNYQVIFDAEIEEGWKIYAPDMEEGGPIPTDFVYEAKGLEIVSPVQADRSPKVMQDDEIFQMEVRTYEGKVKFFQEIKVEGTPVLDLYIDYMACSKEVCIPYNANFNIDLSGQGRQMEPLAPTSQEVKEAASITEVFEQIKADPISDCTTTADNTEDLWGVFLRGIIFGLFAILTPCVFPMIPLTVSFFTKRSTNRRLGQINGMIYGLSILGIYLSLSLPFHLLDGLSGSIYNELSTNPILNSFFFAVFIVFAFSFFGFYEITLPSRFTNSMNQKSSVGGFIGIFFMAFTLVIVSFSCTGPLLGNVIALSSTGMTSAWGLTAALAGFGVAFGLPFALFAAFPALLSSLPKSGGWLGVFKVVLGFIEIALSIKFLSKADLISEWGIMPREVFFGIWVIVGILTIIYFLGGLKFPADPNPFPLARWRYGAAAVTLGLVILVLPGFVRTIPFLAGFPPPLHYSIFEKESECPLELECHKNDYESALAYAKAVNKPIMIDFTGHGCENCRKMEANVWTDSEIFQMISEEYVLVSLYADDRTKLPETLTVPTADGVSTQKLRTEGSKWAYLEETVFNYNAQPLYVLLSPDQQVLNAPIGGITSKEEYKAFLECGLNTFQQLQE